MFKSRGEEGKKGTKWKRKLDGKEVREQSENEKHITFIEVGQGI
jgi:hypothetical protein